eukprot:14983050-Alexandrium_andersonii.AAC.1
MNELLLSAPPANSQTQHPGHSVRTQFLDTAKSTGGTPDTAGRSVRTQPPGHITGHSVLLGIFGAVLKRS